MPAPKTTLGTYWLPLGDVTDSHGVPVDQYTELPLDYGQSVYVTRQIRGVLMRIAWMGYTLVTYALLALCDFILSLEWLDWVLAPLTLLANSLQGVLDRAGIIGLGIAIARSIAQRHHGGLDLRPRTDAPGLRAELWWPVAGTDTPAREVDA